MVYMVYTLVQLDDPASSSVGILLHDNLRYGILYLAIMILKLGRVRTVLDQLHLVVKLHYNSTVFGIK